MIKHLIGFPVYINGENVNHWLHILNIYLFQTRNFKLPRLQLKLNSNRYMVLDNGDQLQSSKII